VKIQTNTIVDPRLFVHAQMRFFKEALQIRGQARKADKASARPLRMFFEPASGRFLNFESGRAALNDHIAENDSIDQALDVNDCFFS